MMCPGISYSTVHNLIFHTDGSVQDSKLYTEFCNRKQAHFAYSNMNEIREEIIDNETQNLIDQPVLEKYDDTMSAITGEYEVITTFMKIHNISATWEAVYWAAWNETNYQIVAGSMWCQEGFRVLSSNVRYLSICNFLKSPFFIGFENVY